MDLLFARTFELQVLSCVIVTSSRLVHRGTALLLLVESSAAAASTEYRNDEKSTPRARREGTKIIKKNAGALEFDCVVNRLFVCILIMCIKMYCTMYRCPSPPHLIARVFVFV